MADSVHLARWISQFVDEPIDFVLFPSSPHRRIHSLLRSLIDSTSNQMTISIRPHAMRWLAFPFSAIDLLLDNRLRGRVLRGLISKGDFDVVHAVEMQHAGYLILRTRLDNGDLPVLCVTNWGSDVYWFQQFTRHRKKIIQLLDAAKFYSAECQRDVELVRQLGYEGHVISVAPNSGGINLDQIPKISEKTSNRRKIIIKGYTGFVGMATNALKACAICPEIPEGYEIVIYSASIRLKIQAAMFRLNNQTPIRYIKKRTPHQEMLAHFAASRIYIGISLSDGISTSLLEAMATGCFPIQSFTGCANEWLSDEGGYLVDPNSVPQIAECIRKALENDELVDNAAIINREIVSRRASAASLAPQSRLFYRFISDHSIDNRRNLKNR
jgi:glycosyltransferase involved in cell wall biosynthesis